jgi:plastocyanin
MKQLIILTLLFLAVGCAPVQEIQQIPTPLENKTTTVEDIAKIAVEGNKVTIIACEGQPEVLSVAEGNTFTFQNTDPREHTIYIAKKQVTIPVEGTAEMKAEFYAGKGLYVYICDNRTDAGTILVR